MSQFGSVVPNWHSHLYPKPVEMQFPPFLHGFEVHGD